MTLGSPHKGFTLLELVVVLAIAGLFFALSGPSVRGMYDSMQYRDAVRGLYSAAKNAQRDSLASGRPVDLVINVRAKTYWISNGAGRTQSDAAPALSKELSLDVTYAEEVSPAPGLAAIRFFPAGGSTGGEILIRRPTGAGARLSVDWLLGDVRQEAL